MQHVLHGCHIGLVVAVAAADAARLQCSEDAPV